MRPCENFYVLICVMGFVVAGEVGGWRGSRGKEGDGGFR